MPASRLERRLWEVEATRKAGAPATLPLYSPLGSFKKVIRIGEGRAMKRLAEQAAYIVTFEEEFQKLSDAELQGKTAEFRQRLDNGEPLDDLIFEAYAAVREARLRESDQRHLRRPDDGRHRPARGRRRRDEDRRGKDVRREPGALSELAPTVPGPDGDPVGQGVHLVTVNDYLAQRDAESKRGRLGAHQRNGRLQSRT